MTLDERIKTIAENQLPFPENCCAATRSELLSLRKIRVRRMKDQILGLSAEQLEEILKQWEQ
jgi:hypothetical protein